MFSIQNYCTYVGLVFNTQFYPKGVISNVRYNNFGETKKAGPEKRAKAIRSVCKIVDHLKKNQMVNYFAHASLDPLRKTLERGL